MKEYWGLEVYFHAFLISALDGGYWSDSRRGQMNAVLLIVGMTGFSSDEIRYKGKLECGETNG